MIEHVLAAETAYARKLKVRQPQPALDDPGALAELREAIVAALQAPMTPAELQRHEMAAALRRPSHRLARAGPRMGDGGQAQRWTLACDHGYNGSSASCAKPVLGKVDT